MASDDYREQNIYRYARKTYKNNKSGLYETEVNNSQFGNENNLSPRINEVIEPPGCTSYLDREVVIANILHEKCPVKTLAQQQLQCFLDETDKLLYDNTSCGSLSKFLWLCTEILATQNKYYCLAILLISVAFIIGIVLGAASCGSYLGQFNSPILNCLDKLFILKSYQNLENTYSIT